MEPLLAPSDLPPEDVKGRSALERFQLSLVRSTNDPDFEPAYGMLDAEFGAKGELERHDAMAAYFARATATAGIRFIVARDENGAIAGVRDCHISYDSKT